MQQRVHRAIEGAAFQRREKFIFIEIIVDLAIHQIGETVTLREVVHRDDLRDAARIERLDNIGADKARCAGYDVSHCFNLVI